MWLSLGTVAIAAFGGTFLLHYLKNFLLKEKRKFSWDWDGVIERGLIAGIIVYAPAKFLLIPLIIFIRVAGRLVRAGLAARLAMVNEPALSFQKVLLKQELAFDLLVSPLFAILIGTIF